MIFFSILFNHIFNSKLVRNMCGCVCVDVIRENQVVKYLLYGCVYMTSMGKLIILSNWFGRTYLSFRKATRRLVTVPLSKQIIDLRGHFNTGIGLHILSLEKYTKEISLIYESSLAENFQTVVHKSAMIPPPSDRASSNSIMNGRGDKKK